jgi:hypothetical protein
VRDLDYRKTRSIASMLAAVDEFRKSFKPALKRTQVVCFYDARFKVKHRWKIVSLTRERPEWREKMKGLTISATRGIKGRICVVFRISDVKAGRTPASPYFVIGGDGGKIIRREDGKGARNTGRRASGDASDSQGPGGVQPAGS